MTQDEERWAEAFAVERMHGEGGPRFIADRIGALAVTGDMEGVQRWREIAIRYDRMSFDKGKVVQ